MNKLGRNEPCACGSGKKYKKCCANKPSSLKKTRDNSHPSGSTERNYQGEQQLITTITHELHMPVRLYYEIYDKAALIKTFNKLRCMKRHEENLWYLLYDDEAKKFGLSVKYHQIEKSRRPIVLGYCYLVNDQRLHIDVRSFKRAARMVEFIDHHINRACIKVTHAAAYNEVMTMTRENARRITHQDINALFALDNITETKPKELIHELMDEVTAYDTIEERIKVTFEQIKKIAQRPKGLVEKTPICFYEDGIKSFESALRTKEIIAMKHYEGDTSYSSFDVASEIADRTKKSEKIIIPVEQQTDTARENINTMLESLGIQR